MRMRWCRFAGVKYWKVDWGTKDKDICFRRMLTEVAKEEYPELIIEHAIPIIPFNGNEKLDNDCRYISNDNYINKVNDTLEFSEVFRSYDVGEPITTVTTIDRLSYLLSNASNYVNCEDEVYLGAVLGLPVGIMRSKFWDKTSKFYNKLYEAVACIKWHQVANVFKGGSLQVSKDLICDYFDYKDDIWFENARNKRVKQYAPMVMARNCDLVDVKGNDSFVVSCLNPNNVYSIGVFLKQGIKESNNLVDVKVDVPENVVRLGVFGDFNTLSLVVKNDLKYVIMRDIVTGKEKRFDACLPKLFIINQEMVEMVRHHFDDSSCAIDVVLVY